MFPLHSVRCRRVSLRSADIRGGRDRRDVRLDRPIPGSAWRRNTRAAPHRRRESISRATAWMLASSLFEGTTPRAAPARIDRLALTIVVAQGRSSWRRGADGNAEGRRRGQKNRPILCPAVWSRTRGRIDHVRRILRSSGTINLDTEPGCAWTGTVTDTWIAIHREAAVGLRLRVRASDSVGTRRLAAATSA